MNTYLGIVHYDVRKFGTFQGSQLILHVYNFMSHFYDTVQG